MPNCTFCGSPTTKIFHIAKGEPKLDVLKCTKCSLVQVNDFAHANVEYYEAEEYFDNDFAAERERQSLWNQRRAHKLEEYFGDLSAITALDFGCGQGGFLEIMEGRFKAHYGFDVSQKVCGMNAKKGWTCFSDLDEIPRPVDVITFFHVLEHIPNAWDFVANIAGQFPETRYFVFEVPHTGEALMGEFNAPTYIVNHYSPFHVYYYDNKTLGNLADRAGLKVVSDDQLQRYPLGNHLGWISNGKGGGQNIWTEFNDPEFHSAYAARLEKRRVADSVFLICERK